MLTRVPLFLFMIALGAEALFALSHSRGYQWAFRAGNLAGNWSFESPLDFWMENPYGGFAIDTRFKAAGTAVGSAKAGSFVAKVSGTNSGGSAYQSIRSSIFPAKSSSSYTLSLYYQASGLSGAIKPVVDWFSTLDGAATPISGNTYVNAGTWDSVTFSFSTPANAQYLRITLAEFSDGASGTLYFDNVSLEEGTLSSAQVVSNRRGRFEAVSFGDGLGRMHQSQIKANGLGTQYLVSGVGFDNFARPETTFLATPLPLSTPGLQSDLLSQVQAFYDGADPFDAHGYPFSRVKYADEPSGRILETSSPDSPWQFGQGHTVKQDYYFVNDTLVPANIENPSTNATECRYRLDWVKNQDSSFSLTWTNKLGQVVRQASNISRSTSGANTWKWAATRQDYFPSGQLQKVRTPIDDSAGTEQFAEVSEYDAQGQIISAFSPDRNLRKFWYNRQGQIRYSQDSVQRPDNKYTYFEYDTQGRLIGEGLQTLTSIPQDSVDKDSYSPSTRVEQIGYIYDDTSSFYSRTGVTLQDVLGYWKMYLDAKYTHGRLVCKYNRNQDNAAPGFATLDKFVADFFRYDSRGRVMAAFKFIGPIKDPLKRIQDVWYNYDEKDRLASYINYHSISEAAISNAQTYTYDFMGRVDSINGLGGRLLSRYTYGDWGPLEQVRLGGTVDSATYIQFFHQTQGSLREIRATGAGNITIFQQFLGYEGKALNVTGVPSLLQPKYDGSISQQVYKYTSDMNPIRPVRAVNYGYDQIGRMGKAKAYWNTNDGPLNTSTQEINTSTLTMDTTGTLSSSLEYDLNGRILGQRSAGVSSGDSAQYYYPGGSYKLDRVTGKLSSGSTRTLSASGTLVYDANGALTQDKSKKMRVAYGWDGLPASFTIDSLALFGTLRCCNYDANMMPIHYKVRYPSLTQYNFYDADGNRVSRVEVESKPALRFQSNHYVYIAPGMLKEWGESYHLSGRLKTTSVVASLNGRSGQIGRIRSDGAYEFFVKNHLGSTMLTVDDRGRYETGRAMDYLAYGSYKDLKVNGVDPVTQKFTGKEFEKLTGLHHFGWRNYDSELGIWTSPDPLQEFFNPYSYVGGDPVNRIDPNGLSSSDCAEFQDDVDAYHMCMSSSYQTAIQLPDAHAVWNKQSGQWMWYEVDPNSLNTLPPNGGNYGGSLGSNGGSSGASGEGMSYEAWVDQQNMSASELQAKRDGSAGASANSGDGFWGQVSEGKQFNNQMIENTMLNLYQQGGVLNNVAAGALAYVGALNTAFTPESWGGAALAFLPVIGKLAPMARVANVYSVAFETSINAVGAGNRAAHFRAANGMLLEAMRESPELAATMKGLGISVPATAAGLARGLSPAGWTWHHAITPGVMQLVPRAQHTLGSPFWEVLHPGGRGGFVLWGAGY